MILLNVSKFKEWRRSSCGIDWVHFSFKIETIIRALWRRRHFWGEIVVIKLWIALTNRWFLFLLLRYYMAYLYSIIFRSIFFEIFSSHALFKIGFTFFQFLLYKLHRFVRSLSSMIIIFNNMICFSSKFFKKIKFHIFQILFLKMLLLFCLDFYWLF